MDISDIIGDSISYPLHNIKALLIFAIIGIIGGIAGGTTILGIITATATHQPFTADALGIVGFIIFIIILLIIQGYTLDIVKYGIERKDDAPGISPKRQFLNAIKYIVVDIVYYIIPAVISWLLLTLLGHGILTVIISFIIYVVFALANFMAVCRLAETDSLGVALAIPDAIGDISSIGIFKIIAVVAVVFIVLLILYGVTMLVFGYQNIVGSILLGALGVYGLFFSNRAMGLLYSDV